MLSSTTDCFPKLLCCKGFEKKVLVVAGAVAVKGIRTATDTVTVTGASTERLKSDFADWTVTVSGNGLSQQQAYQNLQPDLKRTLAFLRDAEIPEEPRHRAFMVHQARSMREFQNVDLPVIDPEAHEGI